jgi:uncharacterized protein
LNESIAKKLEVLKKNLKGLGSVLLAYSGGIDSTLLLKVAKDTLSDKVLAVTISSEAYPKERVREAQLTAERLKSRHKVINLSLLSIPEFVENRKDRCYHCKLKVFESLMKVAKEEGLNVVVDGTNYDDGAEYRPGLRALKELKIRSPLMEAKLKKDEVRWLSKFFGLKEWNKPPFTCLASRFPYGTTITQELLNKVHTAESFIQQISGARQVRLRHHEEIARIEVDGEELSLLVENRVKIVNKLKDLGYLYVTIDLEGYRRGSMDEPFSK